MQIDEERSLRSVGKEGDCQRKMTVTIRHQRVSDKHDSKCPNPNPRLRLPSLRVIQLLNLHLLQRKDSWMESVLAIQFPAMFPDPPPQSDEFRREIYRPRQKETRYSARTQRHCFTGYMWILWCRWSREAWKEGDIAHIATEIENLVLHDQVRPK